tara:strand:- start:28 stop:252 length:225 start_codon:yes stop_codon:yes gene_type:complete
MSGHNYKLRVYMFYKDLIKDVRFLYDSGIHKFLESKKYHNARQRYLELEQNFSKPKSDKKLDIILGITKEDIDK